MYKIRPSYVLALCILLTVTVIFLKLFFPELIYFNSGLMLVLLLTVFLPEKKYTYSFFGISLAIIFMTIILTRKEEMQQSLPNQLLAACVAALTTMLILYYKRMSEKLEGERTNLNALFEHAAEGIVLTKDSGHIVMVNPEALRQFGYEAKDLIGKTLHILMPGRLWDAYDTFVKDYEKVPLNQNLRNSQEVHGLKQNGNEFPMDISRSHFVRGKEKFVIFFITDITKRKEVENHLIQQKEMLEKVTHDMRKMNTELENKVSERTLILQEALQELEKSQQELSEALDKEKELSEIKSRFVSMASHEFRTPLSTILSSASLISKYVTTEDHEKREKHTSRIKNSVKHLNELLEDFLNIGKLEEGRVLVELQQFDVREFLQDTVDEMGASLKMGQRIHIDFEGQLMFRTDKRLLKNVLLNLLSNAIKFSDADKPIEITGINSGATINLQVKDQGMGIPPEDLPHLFSTFYRAKNVVNIQGTGLGLHIVKRYIDMLNGNISLSSKLAEGTTFKILLPELN